MSNTTTEYARKEELYSSLLKISSTDLIKQDKLDKLHTWINTHRFTIHDPDLRYRVIKQLIIIMKSLSKKNDRKSINMILSNFVDVNTTYQSITFIIGELNKYYSTSWSYNTVDKVYSKMLSCSLVLMIPQIVLFTTKESKMVVQSLINLLYTISISDKRNTTTLLKLKTSINHLFDQFDHINDSEIL